MGLTQVDLRLSGSARLGSLAEWGKRRSEGRARIAWWRQQLAAVKVEQARAGILDLEAAIGTAPRS
jgi:hypothetical protein